RAAKIINALLFMIAKDNLSLNTVEKDGFHHILKLIAPLYKIPARKQITELLDEKYNNFVIEPYFFDGSVNTESYCNLLMNHLPLLIEELSLNVRRDMWFQQDGASPHFSRTTLTLLNEIFRDRWIDRGSSVQWLPYSLDLLHLWTIFYGGISKRKSHLNHLRRKKTSNEEYVQLALR
ncbi:hypothetical protein ALC60_08902, partial [Trachymyrmex zeteki]